MSTTPAVNVVRPRPRAGTVPARDSDVTVRSGAYLMGVGSAVPAVVLPQETIERELAGVWGLRGRALDRWQRICRGAEIEQRYGVQPIEASVNCSTAQRMVMYESLSPMLAEHAARDALDAAGIDPSRVSDLVVVSCTGFTAPGLDVALVRRLGLRTSVRRTMIGFMGCFGAINGLRSAVGTCAADQRAVTLVVCCELCSLHVRRDANVDNQVACALFGDGAAAAVVAGEQFVNDAEEPTDDGGAHRRPIGRLTLGHSELIPASEAMMRWRITDTGFAMTLDRKVPSALRESIAGFIDQGCAGPLRMIAPHPGGPGVLDAIEIAVAPHLRPGINAARDVLRTHGNMSSGTVLFVLQRLLRNMRSSAEVLPVMLLAFGPGLTIEGIEIVPIAG